jgi:cytoskeletal protein CcmA (bactofilin family)
MASTVTTIGKATHVRGRVTGGATDLEVRGFVEGEIVVGGDVTIDANAMVGAGVQGKRLVVRGAVKGDLVGQESVFLEEGARVVGDVRAPRVAIAPGALVRGYVETGQNGATPARASRAQGPAAVPKAVAVAKAKAPPAPHSRPAVQAAPAARAANVPRASASEGERRPPPPVVPALKKAKGQIAKKKER